MLNRPVTRLVLPEASGVDRPAEVGLYTVVLGDTGILLDGLADRLDGLVVAGFGVGHVPANLVEKLASLASRIPVVLASRTGAGSVVSSTYAFPGSESDLFDRGLICAGYLDPLKSRILLRYLVSAGCSREDIQSAFRLAGHGIVPESSPKQSDNGDPQVPAHA